MSRFFIAKKDSTSTRPGRRWFTTFSRHGKYVAKRYATTPIDLLKPNTTCIAFIYARGYDGDGCNRTTSFSVPRVSCPTRSNKRTVLATGYGC